MEPIAVPDPSGVLVCRDALIVSEVRFLRDSLVEILARIPDVGVREHAATLAQAVAAAASVRPAIVLLDVAFPGGPQAAVQLCCAAPEAHVIAIGIRESEETVLSWAEAGIAGYVPNTASINDLLALIQQIVRGEQPCPSHIAGSLLRRVAAASRHVAPAATPLTRREQEIVQLVGVGLCNKDIARRLRISLGTTKTHVHNVLGKLSLQRRADLMTRLHAAHDTTISF